MIYEMIPENSCSAVSIASFLVYFSTYVIILQENIGILIENQIQTTSASPCRTPVQPAASFLVCSLIFIEYKQPILFLPSKQTRIQKTVLTFPVASD